MITSIFLIPLAITIIGIALHRFVHHRRPYRPLARVHAIVAVFAAMALPLPMGVWVPNLLGFENTVSTSTSATGHLFRIVQRWNHSDFYSTQLEITDARNRSHRVTLNGDDPKLWGLPMEIDERAQTVTAVYTDHRVEVGYADADPTIRYLN